ncbi:hypothetical protein GCM10010347_50510 [Streptomyces cirratus]|uniref:Minor tail protein n=1 Tax=Streptomyces cirratus TaxID=68187 RepID=A0ABQ3F2R1_9ACTN|nr:hypothetical protein GCM10010347_50510 [Streptomyces cirratus]
MAVTNGGTAGLLVGAGGWRVVSAGTSAFGSSMTIVGSVWPVAVTAGGPGPVSNSAVTHGALAGRAEGGVRGAVGARVDAVGQHAAALVAMRGRFIW